MLKALVMKDPPDLEVGWGGGGGEHSLGISMYFIFGPNYCYRQIDFVFAIC